MARYSTRPPLGTPLNPAHPLNRGLVVYWPMAEGAGGKTMDLSGNGNHGHLTNIVQGPTSGWTGGNFGGAMSFDGVNDAINAEGFVHKASAFSVSFWILGLSRSNYNQTINIGGAWGSFVFHTDSGGAIFVGTDQTLRFATSELPSNTFVLNKWQHFIYTHNGTTGEFYKDGVRRAGPKAQNITAAGNGFNIQQVVGSNRVHGSISEVRIYNRALSASEVRQLYTDPFCMYEQQSLPRWFVPGGVVSRAGSFFFGR